MGDSDADGRLADVVVVGSGAAGLATAITAAAHGCAVEVLEKSDLVGGTTAVGGGGIWIPCNAHMPGAGAEDTREEALAYLGGVTAGRSPAPELLEVYVDRAHEAIAYFEGTTALRFGVATVFSDYFQHVPGAKLFGRTLDPAPFASRERLGPWHERVRDTPHYRAVTLDELSAPEGSGGGAGAAGLGQELLELSEQRARQGIRTLGGGLTAALLRSALDAGVAVTTGAEVIRLVLEDGRVVGVVAQIDGAEVTVRARRGVMLAAGGFEWNAELVRAFLGVPRLWPVSSPTGEGAGLTLGLAAGAAVANMTVAWGFPVTSDGVRTYAGKPLHHHATPRLEPGCIVVNARGRRFINEGVSYMDFVRAFREYDATTQTYPNEAPVWAVFDQRVRDRVTLNDLEPHQPDPAWVTRAPTLAALAAAIGVDADGLAGEVARFNGFVAEGVDRDFGRGTVWFEAFTSGGPTREGSLAPIGEPPYYAVAIYDGALGTAGGLRIDEHARVISMAGEPIPGLYAAGNTAASIFGPTYPAGGVTIGPALTFGHLAGLHLAGA